MAVPVEAPETLTVCPINRPSVAVQLHCPATPVTATEPRFGATRFDEETEVLAGMPVPEIVCPAPTKVLTEESTMLTVLLRITDSVNTPICDIDEPLISPYSTGVLAVLSIAARFCPGWAKRTLTPDPATS